MRAQVHNTVSSTRDERARGTRNYSQVPLMNKYSTKVHALGTQLHVVHAVSTMLVVACAVLVAVGQARWVPAAVAASAVTDCATGTFSSFEARLRQVCE